MSEPFEEQQLEEYVFDQGAQVHSETGDKWQRHTSGPKRDTTADRETAAQIQREKHGEVDADGVFRPSTWRPA